jgi:hypothetical protein
MTSTTLMTNPPPSPFTIHLDIPNDAVEVWRNDTVILSLKRAELIDLGAGLVNAIDAWKFHMDRTKDATEVTALEALRDGVIQCFKAFPSSILALEKATESLKSRLAKETWFCTVSHTDTMIHVYVYTDEHNVGTLKTWVEGTWEGFPVYIKASSVKRRAAR